MPEQKYKVTTLNAAGNITALVEGVASERKRCAINDLLQNRYPEIEQVGFYNRSPRLCMAGGEFCGNALRSLAYLLLQGRAGNITANVSGCRAEVQAGVRGPKTAYADIPFPTNKQLITQSAIAPTINLDGIRHTIICVKRRLGKTQACKRARRVMDRLDKRSKTDALGVMFVRTSKTAVALEPVVFVPSINTLYYEGSCASGSAAVALWLSRNTPEDRTCPVVQPSGSVLLIRIQARNTKPNRVEVDGPVQIIKSLHVAL